MTGPCGCEITGIAWPSDPRTMFVGIEHSKASFPDGEGKLPRSTVVAIKRKDNGLID